MPAVISHARSATFLVILAILLLGCGSSAGPAAPSTAPATARPTPAFDPLVVQALTADTITQRSLAILATTQDDTSESLVKTAAAIKEAAAIVAHSLANAQTPGFKAARPRVIDGRVLMQLDMTPGAIENTNRQLDVAIDGEGFLRVKVEDKTPDHLGYTRSGSLFLNRYGELVVGLGDGYRLDPPIVIPPGVTTIIIAQDGVVEVLKAGSVIKTTVGQIKLWRFTDAANLGRLRGNIYTQTPAAGEALEVKPADDGAGTLLQGYLEQSNVDLTREQVRLVRLKEWQEGVDRALRLTAPPAGRR